MERRLGRRKFRVYAMDIESHNDEESLAKRETSAWLGCFIDENSKAEDPASYFYSMEEFVDKLESESRPQPRRRANDTRKCANICVYIYNLSFEWSFLLPVLLERGFRFSATFGKEEEKVYTTVSTKSVSSVWEARLRFDSKHGLIVIRDLAKIYGGGLANVAKAFGLETQKGEIDYRENRLHREIVEENGRRHLYVTDEERVYCFKDTRIIIEILLKMQEINDRDFWGAISMASYSMKKMLRFGWPRSFHPYKRFREKYPELDQEETDFLRKSVAGGITYACEAYQYKNVCADIGHIDLHQAHPSSLYWHLYPSGKGTYFKGRPMAGKICCCRILVSYDDVRLHSVIALIGTSFITDRELTVWDFEIPTMMKCYVNLRITYLDGYAYEMHTLPWRKYYLSNYNKRKEAKARKDSFFTLYYKLLNNSSYGKLLERPHSVIYENYVREDGVIDSIVMPAPEAKVNAKYTYIPVGSCCPAYTRVTLVEAALKLGWRNVLYFDTDSIFFIKNEESMKGVESLDFEDHLGGWGWEEESLARAQFTAPKRYKTEDDKGNVTIKAGGINFNDYIQRTHEPEIEKMMEQGMSLREAIANVPIDYEEVNIVSSTWRVQRAFRCKGGTLIDFQEKEMKVPDKYRDIYEKNAYNKDEDD